MHLLQRLSLLLAAGLLFATPALPQESGPKPNKQRQKAILENPWSNAENVAKGAAMLTELYDTAGGLENFKKLDGIRFDLLETWRVLMDRNTGDIKVHHYTPRLCWLTPEGDGWARSEFVKPGVFKPMYRREVATGNFAWSELNGEFSRKPEAASKARSRVHRLQFLTCAPFSFDGRGAELVFLKNLDDGKALYGMRLARPLIMSIQEEISEFVLVIDTKAKRLLQLQYALVGKDRETTDKSTECYVDFEGALKVGDVTLPNKHIWFFELDLRTEEYLLAKISNSVMPPESLRRPWISGGLWETDLRADTWDPPAKEAEPKQ